MADPANKTFEDFERSTQGGGQSECPLGYGSEPQAQQVTYSGKILKNFSDSENFRCRAHPPRKSLLKLKQRVR